jgi:hypothetical protein
MEPGDLADARRSAAGGALRRATISVPIRTYLPQLLSGSGLCVAPHVLMDRLTSLLRDWTHKLSSLRARCTSGHSQNQNSWSPQWAGCRQDRIKAPESFKV